MRCTHCGYKLPETSDACPRCKASLTQHSRLRELLITALWTFVALACVTILTYLVLSWHDAQAPTAARITSWYATSFFLAM